jgi:hypothetical protein
MLGGYMAGVTVSGSTLGCFFQSEIPENGIMPKSFEAGVMINGETGFYKGSYRST